MYSHFTFSNCDTYLDNDAVIKVEREYTSTNPFLVRAIVEEARDGESGWMQLVSSDSDKSFIKGFRSKSLISNLSEEAVTKKQVKARRRPDDPDTSSSLPLALSASVSSFLSFLRSHLNKYRL
ncbi:unnamed protein product [Nezara viridula]|uniref:Uncharacterized protein n=1 Tax=Nezara viridula TaxID=85310 RepID=A0A9P0HK24_NEZVI|nr:unnamed protein product [Nezara viridula]